MNIRQAIRKLTDRWLFGEEIDAQDAQGLSMLVSRLRPRCPYEAPVGRKIIFIHKNGGGETVATISEIIQDSGHTYYPEEVSEPDVICWMEMPTEDDIDYANKEFMRGQI